MRTVSYSTLQDVTDLLNFAMGWLKIQKFGYLENGTFYEIKKFLTCTSDGTFWEGIIYSRANL